MADTRKLGLSERHIPGWGTEKSRDRADARRQIEGLSLADQQVQLTSMLLQEQQRTNQLLEWVGGLLVSQLEQADRLAAQRR